MAMEKIFDAQSVEPKIWKLWEDTNAFVAGANARKGADSYSIMIPPPNVTGVLHMGHAFNNTLQDILVRWHRMRGYDTLWQAGMDHAGIATQIIVERMLAETNQPTRTELGREAFLKKVWEWKEKSGGAIINQLKRLGASCDWDRTAFTMAGAQGDTYIGHENSPNFHDAVIKVFVDMYNKGLIYRGKRLVNWDPYFETAISDLEVNNIEVEGHMWHFKYPLANNKTYTYIEKDEDGNVTLTEERAYISIATTRPETMFGDGAIAVHPSDTRYAPIIGEMCEIPLGPKEHRRLIPIIRDEYPDPNFGSGAVKITGAHDFNDYQVAKKNAIPMYSLMDTRGFMRSDGNPYAQEAIIAQRIATGKEKFTESSIAALNIVPDEYRGLDRFEARKKVIADINSEGLAVTVLDGNNQKIPFVENKLIMQPFGDRSKVVIEPMLTDQWFVDTSKIVKPALDVVRNGKIKILPESSKKTYYHWLDNIEPWCISRQLWWGHQIPVWFDENGQEYCAATIEEAQALAGAKTKLTRDPDVLDTWFSSGLWPIGTLGWPKKTNELHRYFPTSDLITGQDILFFWVARMIMMQLAVVDEIPFKTVYLHGLVRDNKGKKMSKSIGNIIDPLSIINEYGADALRFSNTAMASLGGALKLDTQRITGYRNFGTKLWNAARFAEFNQATPTSAFNPSSVTQTLNKWIIGETALIHQTVDNALHNYRFNDAAMGLYSFIWNKVCDWYIELSKSLLQDSNEIIKTETKATLAWVLDQCYILLHPIMPFITEELWQQTSNRKTILAHADWPDYTPDELFNQNAHEELEWVINLIEQIRSLRAELHVNASAKIPMLQLDLDNKATIALQNNQTMIMKLARIDTINKINEQPDGSIIIAVEGGRFCLPLKDIVNIAAEKERLGKAISKLEKELNTIQEKLANKKFIANAPDHVISKSRERIIAGEAEIITLRTAFDRIAQIK